MLSEFAPGQTTPRVTYLPGIAQKQGTTWSYFGTDGLGSTRFMLNAARNITYAANYDPYGQVMAQYLPDATPSFGFTGQMTDASGLQYLRARYYDPSLGAFLSQDPKIGAYPQLSASWNGYSYAHANPTTFIDPSGEIPLLFAAAVFVGGTIIGGVSYGAWDVSVEQGIGLGGHNQFNFGAINWGQAGGAFRKGANTGMAVSSFFTGLRTSYTAARMGAGAGRYLASHTGLDFGLGVAGDMVINGDSVGEAALWNAAGFVGGEAAGYAGRRVLKTAGDYGHRLLHPGRAWIRYADPLNGRGSGLSRNLQDAIARAIREGDPSMQVAFRSRPVGSWRWDGKVPAKPVPAKNIDDFSAVPGWECGLRACRVPNQYGGDDYGVFVSDLDVGWAASDGRHIFDDEFITVSRASVNTAFPGLGPLAGPGARPINRGSNKVGNLINKYYGHDVVMHGMHINGMIAGLPGATMDRFDELMFVFGRDGFITSGKGPNIYRNAFR